MSDSMLAVNRISVTFGAGGPSVRVLSNVSLVFPIGTVTLIIGPSGSGKTTLLSVLGCLLKPDDGSVIVNGSDVTTLTEDKRTWMRRSQIGFIFQSFRLFNSLTALENVMFAMEIAGKNGPEVRTKAKAELEALGMSAKLHLKPNELSGGEKQRVAIARALIREPKILLADEPTASLDSVSGDTITRILHDIAEIQQRTVVIVSHDERLRAYAKNVVRLRDGEVVETPN